MPDSRPPTTRTGNIEPAAGIDTDTVVAALRGYRFRFTDELSLHEGLAAAFERAGLHPEREVVLSPANRIDFLLGTLGIEVKVKGAVPDITRQLRRYAAIARIEQLLLVTTRAAHRAVPAVIDDVPVRVLYLPPAFR